MSKPSASRSDPDATMTLPPGPNAARQTAQTAGQDPSSAPATPGGSAALPKRYQRVRQLGSGSFGEVVLVLDRRLQRTVAMKILRPEALSPELAARFLAEIRLSAGLHHPGIVPVHDYGKLHDGRLWFTMAEVRGRTFRAVIDEAFAGRGEVTGPARRRLLDIFARVCDAVAYAHSAGVIHRDIKPDNVMVGDFGRVLVMDWGLARKVGAVSERSMQLASPAATDDKSLTRAGVVLGTPAYMAPEQARGDVKHHGPATDVYALGAMLYHVLSGANPYARGGSVRLGPPDPLPAHAGPPELLAICERAMARAPEDRYPDAGALSADIEAFAGGARRREQALGELAKAEARLPEIARQRAQAEALRVEARQLLEPVQPFDPVAVKLPGWEREDEAARLAREATLGEAQWEQEVHGALAIDPDLPEAHAAEQQSSYARDAAGRFALRPDAKDNGSPRAPAVLMTWHGAMAYARWMAERSGRPYRLLNELEQEKAARGADGRRYPWGDCFDPTWACMVNSTPGALSCAHVDEYPLDESPYGVRGLAGNTHDLCLNLWTLSGPEVQGDRLLIEPPPAGGDEFRAVRGGSWRGVAGECLAAARHATRPTDGWNTTGLRVARSCR